MRKILTYVLMASVLLLMSCADSQQKPIKVGNKFMKAYLVDVDFAQLMRYSTGDATGNLQEVYDELGTDGIAKMREQAKEVKAKYVLNEKFSAFSKSHARLVYEVRVGPDYQGFNYMELELLGYRGTWRVSFYSL